MPPNASSRLETGTAFIKDLISDIKKGEIKIPQFQRKFVWKEQQALELLDSVAKTYPIGSLLLWKTKVKLAVERNIGDFRLPETDDLTPTDYVLDGQQRLTVIYSCLGAQDRDRGFAAAYDLERMEFLQKPDEHVPHVFPLRWLFDTTKMLDFRTGLKSYPEQADYQLRLDQLITSFGGYRLPIVTLKDLTIEEVCPIFERINSSGTKLSIFDLMVAATWSHEEFDLNEAADTISDRLESKGFNDVDQDTILKCLTAVVSDGIKKPQVLALRTIKKADMGELVKQTTESLLRAVDLLFTEFRICTWDFLPYEAILIILSYLLSKEKSLCPEKLARIRQWFWRASFSERYRVGGEGFITRDLQEVRRFLDEEQDASFMDEPPNASRLGESLFRSSNSRAKAFVLALARLKPRNLTNGSAIDTADALSAFNRKQYHHIYPKAYLKRTKEPLEANSIVNICMLAASENKAISDDDPHVYLPACASKLGQAAESVFASNLLPSPSRFDYAKASYAEFCKARSGMLANEIRELCDGHIA